MPNLIASFALFGIEFSSIMSIHFLGNIDKTQGSHFEIRAPTIITLRWVIIARYDAILNQ